MTETNHDGPAVTRWPLQWPINWTRTINGRRVTGLFRDGRAPIGVPRAVARLAIECERLGADYVTLSTNLRTRLDGTVIANTGEPADPGVAIYFTFKGRATVFACDRYTRVADNLAAIAAHIEAVRRIDRYGVGSLEQALAGYRALPADTAADWRAVFGFPAGSRPTDGELEAAFKLRARGAHPDTGGSDAAMAHVNRARQFAREELKG